MSKNVVVIGAGQAATAFAAKLRELDEKASITIIGVEPSLPYQRPPLSKKYMTGEMEAERLLLRPSEFYDEHNITCITNAIATKIDPAQKQVTYGDESIAYDKLVIATGASPRLLPASIGGDLDGVFALRDLADADNIAEHIIPDSTALIIGGGYIGLEAAAVLSTKGMKVRVVEMADRILQRVASKQTSDFVRTKHQSHGVEILESTSVERLEGENGKVKTAIFADGSKLDVDIVLVGIGVIANMALASEAGLNCSNGIDVDEFTRTSDPDIHAVGDVAAFEFRSNHCRIESVQNAIDQGEAAAKVIAGEETPYAPLPWFWSDQYDMKLQIAGLNIGYDETVIRPGSREGGQSVWYFMDGALIAVDAINDAKAYMFGKKILETGKAITPEQASDSEFDLKALIMG